MNNLNIPCSLWNEVLPSHLDILAQSLSMHFQVDKGLTIPVILGIAASLTQDKFALEVSDGQNMGNSYIQPLSLFLIGFAESSERKSPLFAWLKKSVDDLVSEYNRQHEDERISLNSTYNTRIAEIKTTRRKIINLPADSPKRYNLEQRLVELEKQNSKRPEGEFRLFLQDATGSATAKFMDSQANHAVTIADPEGGSISKILQDHQFMELLLSGHSNEEVSFERSTKPSLLIKNPHASICILTQYAKLNKMVQKTDTWGEGLIPRSLIFLIPSRAGSRSVLGNSVPQDIKSWWEFRLKYLFDFSYKLNERGDKELYVLRFSQEAAQAWSNYVFQIERMQGIYSPTANIKNWLGKAGGNIARLAAVYHLFECDTDPVVTPIDAKYVYAAYTLIMALVPAMQQVYCLYFPNHTDAVCKKIVNWLRGGMGTIRFFSLRDMYRELGIKSTEAGHACQVLVQHRVLWQGVIPTNKVGRMASPVFNINYQVLNTLPLF